ncbi:MAG: hypothetical protein DLM57_16425 [Pseudonocardiales bacterium]|nr:MAG: hypothetical protein DLM57_16425 [Pseudonocardiales bacterium]
MPNHAAIGRTRAGTPRARRSAVSYLTLGLLATGFVAAVTTVNSAPAVAEGNNIGYYTSGNGVSGFCVDPGITPPDGRTYTKGPKFGNDISKVLSWFATHYGPSGSNPGGGGGYNQATADPRVSGLTSNPDAVAVTTAIGRDIVLGEGGSPIHGVDDTFTTQLLAFAKAHQGPWDLKISLNFAGPYTVGNTYNGHLQITDKNGGAVPVGGINISVTGQTNVSVSIPGTNETDNSGRLDFTFKATATGAFDAQFNTDDVAGRAPIYEDSSTPSGYQRLLTPERASASANLAGFTKAVQVGAFIVGKVDGLTGVGLAGAVFNVYNAAGQLVDTITTGDGAPGNLPLGIAISKPLPPGLYDIIEQVAPTGYFLDQTGQIKRIRAAQFTAAAFADAPKPGAILIGKVDVSQTVRTNTLVPLPGATFTIYNLAGAVVGVVTTDANGLAVSPALVEGYYVIVETVTPPGFATADPQLQQVRPGAVTDALFADRRQPELSTQISDQTARVGDTITDSITVTKSNGYQGPVIYVLYGPVAPVIDLTGASTCVGAPFVPGANGSPVAQADVVTVNGDGTYPTKPFTITTPGCYTYSEFLVGDFLTAPAGPTAPGAVTETTLARVPNQPEVTTQVSAQTANVGDTIHDSIKVTNSNGYTGPIRFTLFGPVAPLTGAGGAPTCVGALYTTAPLAQTGTVAANGDGTVVTPGYKITEEGCYSYTELLVGSPPTTLPAPGSPPGFPTETVLASRLPNQPAISTQISKQTVHVGDTLTDAITVTNSNGFTGQLTYKLLGPVTPLTDTAGAPTCIGVNYAAAATAQAGAITANGDNTYTSAPFTVKTKGCYTYSETLVGNATTPGAGPTVPGAVTETVLVKVQPKLSTAISLQEAAVGTTLTDHIVLTGSQGYRGPVNWTLLGPVKPTLNAAGSPSCVGLDWTGAPVAASGFVTANGDATYTTAGFTVLVTGCYTYTELLPASGVTEQAGPTTPGSVSETVLVVVHVPTVSTQASKQQALTGDTITDAIKVTGSFGYQGPVNWTLLGPVKAVLDSAGSPTCVGVNWTGAPTAASGTITANGDATYTTAGFTVVTTGCYTYSELLVGNEVTGPAGPSTPGASTETVIVFVHAPAVSTQISAQSASVGDTVTDAITVSGSFGYQGPVKWTLLGPLTPKLDSSGAPTCTGVDWTGAPTAATGSVTANGDGTYTTAGYQVPTSGCYTYVELLVGNATTAPAGPSPPGATSETVVVTTPVTPSGGGLAVTGSDVGTLALSALVLLVTGGALAFGTRRRRRTIAE